MNKALLTDAHKERFGVEESSKPYFVVIKVRGRPAAERLRAVFCTLVRAEREARALLPTHAGRAVAHATLVPRSNKWCLARSRGPTRRSLGPS